MMSKKTVKAVVGALVFAGLATACSTPRVLVNQSFRGDRSTSKIMIVKNGSAVGSGNDKVQLFDTYVRMCSVSSSQESQCKDTLVLNNVLPKSIY